MCIAAHTSVPPDPTLTVDNVIRVINKIEGDKARVFIVPFIVIPSLVLDEIQRFSTDIEKNNAYADYIVTVWPDVSWAYLTFVLYCRNEFSAAKESKSFMSNGKVYH